MVDDVPNTPRVDIFLCNARLVPRNTRVGSIWWSTPPHHWKHNCHCVFRWTLSIGTAGIVALLSVLPLVWRWSRINRELTVDFESFAPSLNLSRILLAVPLPWLLWPCCGQSWFVLSFSLLSLSSCATGIVSIKACTKDKERICHTQSRPRKKIWHT